MAQPRVPLESNCYPRSLHWRGSLLAHDYRAAFSWRRARADLAP